MPIDLVCYGVFLFSICAHEAAHALLGMRLGDPTGRLAGQVSLNPLPHIRREPLGTVAVPILSYLGGGWIAGWASTPYDRGWARQYPRRAGLMAAAGPLANLTLVLGAAIGIRVAVWAGFSGAPESIRVSRLAIAPDGFATMLATAATLCVSMNLLLFVLNLFPVAPFDGGAALAAVLPEHIARRYQEVQRSASGLRIVALLVAWQLAGAVSHDLLTDVTNLICSGLVRYT